MKIAVDITYTPSGGSLTQILNMIKYFNLNEDINIVIYSKKKNEEKLKDVIKKENRIILSWLANIATSTRVVWQQLFLPFYLKRDKIDVLFCPGNIAPLFSTVKTVMWIGTIGPFVREFYQYFSLYIKIKLYINKFLMISTAQKSDAVIFESKYTKKIFNDKYGVNLDKSHVLNIGKDDFFYSGLDYEISERYSIYSPFSLCVSHLYSYKNIPRMIEAFAMAKKSTHSDNRLLIAGGKKTNKYYNQIINTINKLNLQDTVIILGAVSKEDLRYLYSLSEFLIFPSPFENFAYTLVEAMSCGAPIVCSNATAMPETCGDAALYFDPYVTEEMFVQISQFLNNEKLRNLYSKKSIARAKELPNYEDVTLQTLDIMKNLVNE